MPFLRDTDPPRSRLFSLPVLAGSMGLVGFVPFARGTAGTLLCVPLAFALYFGVEWHVAGWLPLAGGFAVLSWLAGIGVLRSASDVKDPSWFVLDEAAGYFLTLALIGAHSPLDIFAGLLTFRLYDIAKPWPVRTFERIPGSLGILMDDLAAAALAAWTWYTIAMLGSALS
ncbi:MAG: phosphatidylglycerophosphatase A [Planctomycetes bacterium]|nr:phosphatidylglycerophosphatase A [Planctomycetota bacterium]